ncbi:hypothetical protein IFM58399_05733 [Aspergillus lentulus]|uniref:Uncharacterized protein n=1 Tax=Aspergillus lentulus TaxID=293939 RepID=A0ABQ1A9X6_ASPLE|nr:uncharacterized protein IFM58399_05733 [Aspergillus lentulus]GFF39879.1 hypothetical protein IFM58399_05733 [Aspergillus lentulus]GFF77076.1 hypothetical protein IFM60648_04865 [Aspergillus lentulus]GFG08617.1 hypothetical protein IFM61392_05462 [Aspergillus lentulus]
MNNDSPGETDPKSSSTLPRKKVKTGAKKTAVKKTGKKTTGKKKPTSSTSQVHLATPFHPQPANTQYAPTYAPIPQTVVLEKPIGNRKGKTSSCLLVCLAVFSYLVAIVLGLYIVTGCVSTTAKANKIYLAEISTNKTYDMSLRVGYFGGCLSVTEAAGVSSPNGSSSAQTSIHCVSNMRRKDLDNLSEDLWEPLALGSSGARSNVQSFLNTTLPQAKHLQENVFFCEPPLVHILLFFVSGIMLLVARTGTSRKKSYKAMLVIAITLSAFSLALALVTVLGSLQGMNALLNISASGELRDLGDSLYISRGKTIQAIQGALAGIVAVFYVSMGVLFVQRTPEGAAGYIVQAFQMAGRPLKKGWGRR